MKHWINLIVIYAVFCYVATNFYIYLFNIFCIWSLHDVESYDCNDYYDTCSFSVSILIHVMCSLPGSKVYVANMGPIWGRQDPGGLGAHLRPVDPRWAPWTLLSRLTWTLLSRLTRKGAFASLVFKMNIPRLSLYSLATYSSHVVKMNIYDALIYTGAAHQ